MRTFILNKLFNLNMNMDLEEIPLRQLALRSMENLDYLPLNQKLIELFPQKNLELARIKTGKEIYHGITPRSNGFKGDEMPLPSEMISPEEYVGLALKIQMEGLKGFHSEGHPIFFDKDFPTIYFSTNFTNTYGHLGVYFKKESEHSFLNVNSDYECVLPAHTFKPNNLGIFVKTYDFLESTYDGGRSSFGNLNRGERKILENHVNAVFKTLNFLNVEYSVLDVGEEILIDQDDYNEKFLY